MEKYELEKYSKLVEDFDGKYRFGYSNLFHLPFLTLKDGEDSRIGGLVIGLPDLISIYPILDTQKIEDVSGIIVDDRLHLYEDKSHLRRYIHDINRTFFNNELDSKFDLEFLVRAEESLFQSGLIGFFIKEKNGVIQLR